MVIDRRLKAAVRYATNRSGGGVLSPADIDEIWEDGKYAELAEDVVRAAKAASGRAPNPDDDHHIARRYHSLVIDGRLKAAVRFATIMSGGGVLSPAVIDEIWEDGKNQG